MKKLSRTDCLMADDLSLIEYEVKAWDGIINLKRMTAAQHQQFEELSNGKDKKDIVVKLVVMCAADEKGNPLFSDDDIPALKNKSGAAILEISEAIIKHNFMSDKDIEDLAKN